MENSLLNGYSVSFGVLQAFTLLILGYVLKNLRDVIRDQKAFEIRDTQEHALLHEKINNVEKESSQRINSVERTTDVLQANYLAVSKDIGEIKSDVKTILKRKAFS